MFSENRFRAEINLRHVDLLSQKTPYAGVHSRRKAFLKLKRGISSERYVGIAVLVCTRSGGYFFKVSWT